MAALVGQRTGVPLILIPSIMAHGKETGWESVGKIFSSGRVSNHADS